MSCKYFSFDECAELLAPASYTVSTSEKRQNCVLIVLNIGKSLTETIMGALLWRAGFLKHLIGDSVQFSTSVYGST